jgi:GGDEF domain-containing protein
MTVRLSMLLLHNRRGHFALSMSILFGVSACRFQGAQNSGKLQSQPKTETTAGGSSNPSDARDGALWDPSKSLFALPPFPKTALELAHSAGLDASKATKLLEALSESLTSSDPVTGLAGGIARMPTLRRASMAAAQGVPVFYIEIDVRNLGGLNRSLGSHSQTNLVFREMVDTVKAALDPLARDGGEIYGFRHGGDEFSFVLRPKVTPAVAALPTKHIKAIQSALDNAQESIGTSIKSWKGSHGVQDLTTIENPKKCLTAEIQDLLRLDVHQRKRAAEACNPHRGSGIYFGVSPVLPLPPDIAGREADC